MNSQCISIGFVGGIARPPTLPTTHTLFCMNSSLVFSKGGWGGRDCFSKGTRHVQSRNKVLNNQTQNSCLLGSVLGSEQTAKCNPTCNLPKGMSEREGRHNPHLSTEIQNHMFI